MHGMADDLLQQYESTRENVEPDTGEQEQLWPISEVYKLPCIREMAYRKPRSIKVSFVWYV